MPVRKANGPIARFWGTLTSTMYVAQPSKEEVKDGSRVALLGRTIERSALRHVLGRVFATGASLALGLPVYDTQCGAKVFRATPSLLLALERPFRSRWAFDVELLGRLLAGGEGVPPTDPARMVEVPLGEWRHVSGSKITLRQMIWAAFELALIARELARTRRPR